jgi:hypothetical protein
MAEYIELEANVCASFNSIVAEGRKPQPPKEEKEEESKD